MMCWHAVAAKDEKHVMISYQWSSKKTVVEVGKRLKNAGFKIWIDVEKMCTYLRF